MYGCWEKEESRRAELLGVHDFRAGLDLYQGSKSRQNQSGEGDYLVFIQLSQKQYQRIVGIITIYRTSFIQATGGGIHFIPNEDSDSLSLKKRDNEEKWTGWISSVKKTHCFKGPLTCKHSDQVKNRVLGVLFISSSTLIPKVTIRAITFIPIPTLEFDSNFRQRAHFQTEPIDIYRWYIGIHTDFSSFTHVYLEVKRRETRNRWLEKPVSWCQKTRRHISPCIRKVYPWLPTLWSTLCGDVAFIELTIG